MSSGERPIGNAKGKQPNTEALCQTPPPCPMGMGQFEAFGSAPQAPEGISFQYIALLFVVGQWAGRRAGGYPTAPPPALLGMGTFLGPWFSEDLGGWVSELPPSPWHGPDLHAESYKRVFHLCRSAFCLHPFDTVSLPLYRS